MSWQFVLNNGFFPVTVTAAGMLLFCVWLGNRRLTVLVAALGVLMYFWRLLYVVQAKRYFIILSVVMIVVTALGADLLERRLRSRVGSRINHVARGLFALLILACLWKTFRINPYQNFIIRASTALKTYAAKYADPLVVDHSDSNNLRIKHYSGINTVGGRFFAAIGDAELRVMIDEAYNYRRYHDAVYFAVQNDKREIDDLVKAGFVSVVSVPRTLKRGKKHFSIYEYAPETDFSKLSGGRLLKKYDMEKCVSIPIPAAKAKLPEMMSYPEITLPEEWLPNFGDGFYASAHAVLKTEDAWSGKALRLAGKKLITIFCPSRKLPATGEYLVTFRYMTLSLSRFRLKTYCYGKDGRMKRQCSVGSLKTEKMSGPAEFRCRIKAPDAIADGYSILAICLDYGDVLIDDLSIYALRSQDCMKNEMLY